jgi:hypothetical protein
MPTPLPPQPPTDGPSPLNLKRMQLAALDKSRYSLPTPAEGEAASEEDWKKAADNARAQLEHLHIRCARASHLPPGASLRARPLTSLPARLCLPVRQANLQLLSEHGPNAHLMHNHLLEAEAKRLEGAAEELKAEVVEINRRRKNEQVRALLRGLFLAERRLTCFLLCYRRRPVSRSTASRINGTSLLGRRSRPSSPSPRLRERLSSCVERSRLRHRLIKAQSHAL